MRSTWARRLAIASLVACAVLLILAARSVNPLGWGLARFSNAAGDAPVSPATAVTAYYAQINAQAYAANWPLLTDRFRKHINCCHANFDDMSSYVLLWDNIQRVDVGTIQVSQEVTGRATLLVDLSYQMKNGQWLASPGTEFQLLWDAANRRWLFDDQNPIAPGG